MSTLEEVMARLNALLGGNALQKASELLKNAEIMLHGEDAGAASPAQKGPVRSHGYATEKKGEKIPPRPQTPKRPQEEKRPISYAQIDFRREKEPLYLMQYRRLRSLGSRNGYERFGWKRPDIFLKQAQYMQTVAPEPCNAVDYEDMLVDYNDLSVAQFRYYAALHPLLLDGDYTQIDASRSGYLFLYFSELICGAAKPQENPKQIFSRLAGIVGHFSAFSAVYRDASREKTSAVRSMEQAVMQLKLYAFDYAVVNELKEEAFVYGDDVSWGVHQTAFFPMIRAYEEADYESLLRLFSEKCPYHIMTTALCKTEPYGKVYPLLFWNVLQALYQRSTTQKEFSEWLFGRMAARNYEPFSLLMTEAVPKASFTFAPLSWISYSYDAAAKRYQIKTFIGPNYDHISDVLRSMDFYMRIEVGGRQLQKPGLLSKTQDAVVAKAVHEFCAEHGLLQLEQRKREQAKKKRAAQKKLSRAGAEPDAPMQPTAVEIDFSKLNQIRADAQDVEQRLLSVYEHPEEAEQETQSALPAYQPSVPVVPKKEQTICAAAVVPVLPDTSAFSDADDDWHAFYDALEEGARQYLALLCKDQDRAKAYGMQLCREGGKTPQLLLEEINALSLTYIGDTILSDEDEAQIYEDYLDAAKAAFLRQEGA